MNSIALIGAGGHAKVCLDAARGFIGPGAICCGGVQAGEGAMIGAGAGILPGMIVGADAIIGAVTVLTRNVPPNAPFVWIPARAISLS